MCLVIFGTMLLAVGGVESRSGLSLGRPVLLSFGTIGAEPAMPLLFCAAVLRCWLWVWRELGLGTLQVFPARHSPHRLLRAFLPGAGSFALRFCAPQLFDTLSPHAEAPGTEEHRAEGDASERAGGWKEAQKADLILLELAANDWAMLQPGMTPPPSEWSATLGESPQEYHSRSVTLEVAP